MNRNRHQNKRLTWHRFFVAITLFLSVASMVTLPAFPSHGATIVYPDTLATPQHRLEIAPTMRPLRKTVGLALSGGGANSIAQIGVLKALEEQDVPVDFIAGTSMGAIVGGLYSSGYSASELESIALSLPWERLVSLDNEAPRTNSYLEQKSIRDRASIAIRFEKFRLVVPKALSAAQPLTRTLDLLVLNAPYHTNHAFSDLPVNFRSVTTDLISGRRVTLTSGPLSEAMRASSTIPILYQPIERNGLKLSDGGLVANLPVDELDLAGAGYKIAVDTHGRMYSDGNDIDLPWKAADQAMTILTQIQYPQQLKHADLVITPDLESHKATDFSDIRALIDAGYAKGVVLSPLIRENIRLTGKKEIDISGFRKTVEGIPDTIEYRELLQTATAVVSKENGVRKILNNLLETGIYSRIKAKVDETARTVVFILEPLPGISHVEITGGPLDALSRKEIDETFRPLTGKPYTAATATRALEQVIRICRSKGYSLVAIENATVTGNTLNIRLSSGAIDTVAIEQDRKLTRRLPVTREMVIDTSRAFRSADAEKTIDNLYGIDVFNRVSLSTENPEPEESRQSTTLTVRLDEKPATVLRLGIRYDDTSNAQLLIDFRNENFNGSGNSIGGWTKMSEKNNRVSLEYSIPRIGATSLTLFTRAYFDQYDIETRQLTFNGQTGLQATGEPRLLGIQKYGFATSFGTRIRKNGRLTADLTLKNTQSYIRDTILPPLSTNNDTVVSIGGQFTLDNRNNSFLPSGGRHIDIRYISATPLRDDASTFWQLVASQEENISIGSATTLQVTALAGIGSENLPLSEKYLLGGTGNALSYRFIGLKEGDLIGNNIAVTGVMLRYRSPFQLIFPTSFILSYNIGNVWTQRTAMSIDSLFQGAGTGLVWDTPLGPAQFTVAKPFTFKNEEVRDSASIDFSKTIFYFTLGHDF